MRRKRNDPPFVIPNPALPTTSYERQEKHTAATPDKKCCEVFSPWCPQSVWSQPPRTFFGLNPSTASALFLLARCGQPLPLLEHGRRNAKIEGDSMFWLPASERSPRWSVGTSFSLWCWSRQWSWKKELEAGVACNLTARRLACPLCKLGYLLTPRSAQSEVVGYRSNCFTSVVVPWNPELPLSRVSLVAFVGFGEIICATHPLPSLTSSGLHGRYADTCMAAAATYRILLDANMLSGLPLSRFVERKGRGRVWGGGCSNKARGWVGPKSWCCLLGSEVCFLRM